MSEPLRTLLIDNYDSFTYNLFQLLSVVNGTEPVVVRNDEVDGIAALGLAAYDNIVISPGPGHPSVPRDFGVSADLIRYADLPLLGVCLGHQGIVVDEGGTVAAAPTPRHGYIERIHHTGTELFAELPQDFSVVRYHSLAAAVPLPDSLEATAWAPDGVVMALRHRTKPRWGVQFHPESVASEHGTTLLRNFADLTRTRRVTRPSIAIRPEQIAPVLIPHPHASAYRLNVAVIDRAVETEGAFLRLYSAAAHAFWLDSEHVEPGLDRFSFLGDASGPLAELVRYDVGDGSVSVETTAGRTTVAGTVFDYLRQRRIGKPTGLPFDFTCGYVGYFGYELRADVGPAGQHRADTPDSQWIFADRMIAVDHEDNATYLLALDDGGDSGSAGSAAAQQWLSETRALLATVPTWLEPTGLSRSVDVAAAEQTLVRDHSRYLADIAICQEKLRAGESYEVCLTNSSRVPATGNGLDLYRVLRRCNPAPYGAYLRLAGCEVACSSPERFLKVDRNRMVESKPIKGTAARGATTFDDDRLRDELASSSKTRAENLMIVDLLRNDLGKVCEIGSVHVPKLMVTETYRTMHQLVSTVRGTLRRDVDVVDCVEACFPGGSMTGAPKLRTMEIIDGLETEARGIYSGAIGFLGLDGTADLNVVIRTAVLTDGEWRIGAGGAIVLDSDAEDEYQEMVLKAVATLRAHDTYGNDDLSAGAYGGPR